jgi:hypothetical protein
MVKEGASRPKAECEDPSDAKWFKFGSLLADD